jgi:hypothetical protein
MQITYPSLPFLETSWRLNRDAWFAAADGRVICDFEAQRTRGSKPVAPPETEKPAGHHHVSSKVSEAQYQLVRKRCQGKKRKMWLTFSHHVYL